MEYYPTAPAMMNLFTTRWDYCHFSLLDDPNAAQMSSSISKNVGKRKSEPCYHLCRIGRVDELSLAVECHIVVINLC